jgi:hypothetical protein
MAPGNVIAPIETVTYTGPSGVLIGPGEGHREFFRRCLQFAFGNVAQYDPEFVATHSADYVTCPQTTVQPVTDGQQHAVGCIVSQRLIYYRQLVDADNQIGALDFIPFGNVQRMVQRFSQAVPIEVTGQLVEVCEMSPAARTGNIGVHKPKDAQETDGFSVGTEFGACPVMHPAFALLGEVEAVFALKLLFA